MDQQDQEVKNQLHQTKLSVTNLNRRQFDDLQKRNLQYVSVMCVKPMKKEIDREIGQIHNISALNQQKRYDELLRIKKETEILESNNDYQ